MTQNIKYNDFSEINSQSDYEFCCQRGPIFFEPSPSTTTTINELDDSVTSDSVNSIHHYSCDTTDKECSYLQDHTLRDISTFKNNDKTGFIDLKESDSNMPFVMFQTPNKKDFKNSLDGINDKTILSGVFFSRKNIDNIQNNIKKEIKKLANYDLDNQSETELQIIMRSIFLQHSKNQNENIQQQIKDLNKLVLKYCVKTVLVNVKQYLGYLKDIQETTNFIQNPESTQIIGDKNNYEFNTDDTISYRSYENTAAYDDAYNIGKEYHFIDGSKVYLKSCESDFKHEYNWRGHIDTNSKTPIIPKTNQDTIKDKTRNKYTYYVNNTVKDQEYIPVSCAEINPLWCSKYGDIEFPQYDTNGNEIYRMSSNQACKTCCTSRNEDQDIKASRVGPIGLKLKEGKGEIGPGARVDRTIV